MKVDLGGVGGEVGLCKIGSGTDVGGFRRGGRGGRGEYNWRRVLAVK
jgi:hypothetical protein